MTMGYSPSVLNYLPKGANGPTGPVGNLGPPGPDRSIWKYDRHFDDRYQFVNNTQYGRFTRLNNRKKYQSKEELTAAGYPMVHIHNKWKRTVAEDEFLRTEIIEWVTANDAWDDVIEFEEKYWFFHSKHTAMIFAIKFS